MLAAETNCRTVLAVGRTHVPRTLVTFRKQDYSSLHGAGPAGEARVQDYETAMHLHTLERAGGFPGLSALFSSVVSTREVTSRRLRREISGPKLACPRSTHRILLSPTLLDPDHPFSVPPGELSRDYGRPTGKNFPNGK